MRTFFHAFFLAIPICASALLLSACQSGPTAVDAQSINDAGQIAPYRARFGRARPLIAVVGDNQHTELTDFVVPYGILSQSVVAEVISVSTTAGPIKTLTDMGKPGFQIQAEATLDQFDARFPDGADYIIVPATHDSPTLLHWIAQQVKSGATIVSICNGALVVAKSGAMNGHRATAHWSTEGQRMDMFPEIRWMKNTRYVADGNWVSSAGVSASIPTSIALVEAIAGHDRAATLARELGVDSWSARHNSDSFQPQLGVNLVPLAVTAYTNGWFHKNDRIGIPVTEGVNEVALALTADAYSSTGRSQAFIVAASKAPLHTRHGLVIIPDMTGSESASLDYALPAPADTPDGKVLDRVLGEIRNRYGATDAYGVALLLEYPGFQD
ncbi:putative intracellular protease/amidase [Oxalobacteraceae bacterium GrIS 1.18]